MNNKALGPAITELSEIKELELNILLAFSDFCREQGLRFYLAYGSLLGAVRHKGFIPWDDDIDLVMPRPDYERLLRLWRDGKYQLMECTLKKDYPYHFAKICDSDTFMREKGVDIDYDLGLYIDVFPLDGIKESPEESRAFIASFTRLEKLRILSSLPRRKSFRQGGGLNLDRSLAWCGLRLIGAGRLSRYMDRRSRSYAYEDSEFVGFLGTRYPEREILPRRVYESSVELKFEGRSFPAPADYDLVLRLLYGDYMSLPPEEERVLKHDFRAWHCV